MISCMSNSESTSMEGRQFNQKMMLQESVIGFERRVESIRVALL